MSPTDLARESRESQGLPPTVTDPSTLAAIATLLANGATPAWKAGVADASSGPGRGVRHAQV